MMIMWSKLDPNRKITTLCPATKKDAEKYSIAQHYEKFMKEYKFATVSQSRHFVQDMKFFLSSANIKTPIKDLTVKDLRINEIKKSAGGRSGHSLAGFGKVLEWSLTGSITKTPSMAKAKKAAAITELEVNGQQVSLEIQAVQEEDLKDFIDGGVFSGRYLPVKTLIRDAIDSNPTLTVFAIPATGALQTDKKERTSLMTAVTSMFTSMQMPWVIRYSNRKMAFLVTTREKYNPFDRYKNHPRTYNKKNKKESK